MGSHVINMVYDLEHILKEMRKRAQILFEKGYKPLFMVLVFKIRSPTILEYPYYVACFTEITNIEETDKAIEVYREVFRGEKLVDFELKINYKWKPPKATLKNIDEVMKKLNELGEEFEKKIAEKLPEKLKKCP